MGFFGKKKSEPTETSTDTGYTLKEDEKGEYVVNNDRDLLESQYELGMIDETEYKIHLHEWETTGKIRW